MHQALLVIVVILDQVYQVILDTLDILVLVFLDIVAQAAYLVILVYQDIVVRQDLAAQLQLGVHFGILQLKQQLQIHQLQ